jgi:hypothetical protein
VRHDESRKPDFSDFSFPIRFLAKVKEYFGDGCELVWADEHGRESGKSTASRCVQPVISDKRPDNVSGSRRKNKGIPSKAYLENMGSPERLWPDEQERDSE